MLVRALSLLAFAVQLTGAAFASSDPSAPSCADGLAGQATMHRAAVARLGQVAGFFEQRATGDTTAGLVLADWIEGEHLAAEHIPGATAAVRCIRLPFEASQQDRAEALLFWRAAGLLPRTVQGVTAPIVALSHDGFPIVEVPPTFLTAHGDESDVTFPLTDVAITLGDELPPQAPSGSWRERLGRLQTLRLRGSATEHRADWGAVAANLTRLRELQIDYDLLSAAVIGALPAPLRAMTLWGPEDVTSETAPDLAALFNAVQASSRADTLVLAVERFQQLEQLRLEHCSVDLHQTSLTFPALRALAIVDTSLPTLTVRSGRRFFRSAPVLERLELDGVPPEVVAFALAAVPVETLRELRLRHAVLPSGGWPRFRRSQRLEAVRLDAVDVSFGRSLAQLPASLRVLELIRVNDFTEENRVPLEVALQRNLRRLSNLDALSVDVGHDRGPESIAGEFLAATTPWLRSLSLGTREQSAELEQHLAGYLRRSQHLTRLSLEGVPTSGAFLPALPDTLEALELRYDAYEARNTMTLLERILRVAGETAFPDSRWAAPLLPGPPPDDTLFLERLKEALRAHAGHLRELTLQNAVVGATTFAALPAGLKGLTLLTDYRLRSADEVSAFVAYLRNADLRRLHLDPSWLPDAVVEALPQQTVVVQIGRAAGDAPAVDFHRASWQTVLQRQAGGLRLVEFPFAAHPAAARAPINARVWVLPGVYR